MAQKLRHLVEKLRPGSRMASLRQRLGKRLAEFRARLYFDKSWIIMSDDSYPENPRWIEQMKIRAREVRVSEPGPTREPHLVLVTGALRSGGAERQWCYLARELVARGYRVTLLTITPLEGDDAHYLPLLEGSGVRVVERDRLAVSGLYTSMPTSQIPIDAWTLGAALDQLQPTHVLAQLDYTNVWSGASSFVQLFPPERVLISFRNVNPEVFHCDYRPYYREYYGILCTSERVVLNANSQSGGEDYARWIGIDPGRVRVAHNAVQLPRLHPHTRDELRRDLGIADSTPVVLGVFRFAPEKNAKLFLEVARAVHEQLPEAVFLHAGVGRHDNGMREAAEEPGMRDWFRLLGRRDDVNELMRAADILLLCSNVEGLPNVVLEAQASELPVVATRVGGTPKALREGETGLLAEAGDRDELARYCIELLRDPERRRRMGRAARKFVETNFTSKILGDAILAQIGLPEKAPVPASARDTVPPGDVSLPVRYWQTKLEELLEERPELLRAPLLIFAHRPLSRKVAALLPPHSLCLTLPGVAQPEEMPSMELDWREPHTYRELKGKVWPGSCALIMGGWPLWENMEGRLRASGVRSLVVLWRYKWYRFPLVGRKIWHELHGFFRKTQRKVTSWLGAAR